MSQRGFSLLEVLVAFSILALSLGVLMRIFSADLNNANQSHDQARALAIAQSLLAATGVETRLSPGETTGRHDEHFEWSVSVIPFEYGTGSGRSIPVPVSLWEISVRVAWGDNPRTGKRSVSLVTLRTQGG